MPFYRDRIYPHLVSMLGNPKPFREVRQRIVPLAEGKVLEIGVGPGVNFVHNDPARVRKVYALEPNLGMIRLAERHRRTADSVLAVRRLSPDTGHSVSHHPGRLPDRADGDGVPRRISEVVHALLVGHRDSTTTIVGGPA
jgi:hypothetical protein